MPTHAPLQPVEEDDTEKETTKKANPEEPVKEADNNGKKQNQTIKRNDV